MGSPSSSKVMKEKDPEKSLVLSSVEGILRGDAGTPRVAD